MSKLLLCVLLVLQALLAGYQQLAVAASAHQIGDDFLCQDPVRGPSGLMLSHAGSNDELNGDSACPGDWTREREEAVIDEAEAFFSGDEYTGEDDEDETLFVARDPDRCADEEEIADGEESPMVGGRGHDAVAEASKDSEELGSSSGGDVECPECGKVFRSDKSMFGHLRSHPDRGYKGATPPRAKPRLVPSRPSTSPSPVNDRPGPGPGPVARYSQRDPNLNAFEMLAGYIMLTLKHRDSRIAREREREQSVNVKREPDVSPEAEDEGSAVSKTGDGVALRDRHGSSGSVTTIEEDNPSEHGGSTAELTAAAEPVRRPSEHGCTAVAVEAPTKSKRERTDKSKEARQVRRKEKDVASAGKGRGPYICKHCQAVFPTHQALGGHMAAHNKDRRVQAQNEQTALDLEAHHQNRQGGDEEEVGRRGGMSASTRALLMERYTRMFNQGWQTRQENGGYRRHTESEDGSTLPQVAPPVADRDRCRLFGINLNVQAPHQE
ncbi:hypothetical protein QYE76_022652 [Lolium multiflorum]|uniref:C2H2-type domain-containing protein n=1 Tax=Lolium multiflorum TaxID=4521 RepID=A0AAD8VTZ3_LOLMU|nr:hypothetical protein QYE76_022652 [Lolium multiflorum]